MRVKHNHRWEMCRIRTVASRLGHRMLERPIRLSARSNAFNVESISRAMADRIVGVPTICVGCMDIAPRPDSLGPEDAIKMHETGQRVFAKQALSHLDDPVVICFRDPHSTMEVDYARRKSCNLTKSCELPLGWIT